MNPSAQTVAVALAMLVSLALYVVLAGADFGGGVWDLLATGPRAAEQRRTVARALAPIWEANHVWLILIVVILFTAFPAAYAAATTALHLPLTLLLLGIVFRGSAFVFRQYGAASDRDERRWGRLFAIASTVTPIFLGVALGAVTGGKLRVPVVSFVDAWWGLFPLAFGFLTLALFAFLAATYLTVESESEALKSDFRGRALAAQAAVVIFAAATALSADPAAAHFTSARLKPWWWPLHGLLALIALAATWALARRRFRLARWLAPAQAVLMVAAWGFAQHPFLIAPDLTFDGAAAPPRTLALLMTALAAGALVLFPSLFWLFHVFKGEASQRSPALGYREGPRD